MKHLFAMKRLMTETHPYSSLLCFLLLFPTTSYAAPIVVTATGQVTYSFDKVNMLGFGIGEDTILGASVTALWSFDTDDAGPNLRDDTWATYWSSTNDWISSSVVLTDSTTTATLGASGPVTNPTRISDELSIHNEDDRLTASGGPLTDLYYLSDGTESEDSGLQRYNSWANVNSTVNDLFSTVTPDTTWIWDEVAGTTSMGGIYYYDNRTGDTKGDSFEVRYTFDSFSVTTVPLPAAAWLFGSGLIGLIGVARRKKS